jgi:hypothetical protein
LYCSTLPGFLSKGSAISIQREGTADNVKGLLTTWRDC